VRFHDSKTEIYAKKLLKEKLGSPLLYFLVVSFKSFLYWQIFAKEIMKIFEIEVDCTSFAVHLSRFPCKIMALDEFSFKYNVEYH